MTRNSRSEQGFTLLIALGILVLLSTFAIVFARIMSMERMASMTYSDGVRARMASRAGVARALAELKAAAGRRHFSDPWADRWAYERQAPANFDPAFMSLDLLTTTQPSYAQADPDGREFLGSPLVYSGWLAQPHAAGSATIYKLKIKDAASQLNLNHADPISIERMLTHLLQASGLPGIADPAATAQTILAGRPPGGFESESALEAAFIGQGLSSEEWRQLQDWITVSAWSDYQVLRPWNKNNDSQQTLTTEARSPINLNTAERPVLVALFAGVRAESPLGTFELDYATAEALADRIIARRGTGSGTGTFTPFTTWPEFEAWVDALPTSVFSGASIPSGEVADFYSELINLKVAHKDLVKAVCNPNPAINKFGPLVNHGGFQRSVPRLVDKSDLVDMTTEACFDAMGRYEITSLGLVLVPDERTPNAGATVGMRVAAAQTQFVVTEVYRPVRITTQADFEQHRGMDVDGNFIPSTDQGWSYGSIMGLNEPVYRGGANMPLPGWPGVVSWPNMSSIRNDDGNKTLRAEYAMATHEGYLTLTNIIGTRMGNPDFVLGFSRGELDAFKGRAWWDPKDEDAGGGLTTGGPTHPTAAELPGLVTPGGGNLPRLRSTTNPAEANLLDEDLGNGNIAGLFTAGSSLLNTGVMLSSQRPAELRYSGDNLDLIRGTSIRFWVQPTADPFLQAEEVLLSFVGSQDGSERQVGFRVYKEALGNQVSIVLEAVGGTSPDSSGVPVDWNWASTNGSLQKIVIDVTPSGPGYVNDPLSPEWIPGTWHWVKVDIGPVGAGTSKRYVATLQVDKATTGETLRFKGDSFTPTGLHEYGELLAHCTGATSPWEPFLADNAMSGRAAGWIMPRLLGDYYHCQAGRNVLVVRKNREYGSPGSPAAIVYQGEAATFFPWVAPWQNPGSYQTGGGWPPTLPFPVLSYNHEVNLNFYDPGGALQLSLPMVRNPAGLWSIVFPAARHLAYGPDVDVDQPEFQTPDGTVVPAATVTDGYPGDEEWHIAMDVSWDEAHYDRGSQHCVNVPMPAPSAIPSIEEDQANPLYGENMPYQCHNSGPTHKKGIPYTPHSIDGFRSWVRVQGPVPHPQGLQPTFPSGPPATFPITYLDDDCHGCEDCDVDGPIYIGGEPSGANGSAINGATRASAVFDNVVIKNGEEGRRVQDFEDRFFETNMSAHVEPGGGLVGYGAVYHRVLREANQITAGELGTLTWTSYNTRSDLTYEVAVWRQTTTGTVTTSTGINPGAPSMPYSADPATGFVFEDPADPDANRWTGIPTPVAPADQLVVGIRLRDFDAARGGVIPAPMTQTPIFEDLTLTIVHDSPMILYAEEGVSE